MISIHAVARNQQEQNRRGLFIFERRRKGGGGAHEVGIMGKVDLFIDIPRIFYFIVTDSGRTEREKYIDILEERRCFTPLLSFIYPHRCSIRLRFLKLYCSSIHDKKKGSWYHDYYCPICPGESFLDDHAKINVQNHQLINLIT